MNKSTRIAGIDNKYGRKSRTGSTISINITDIEAMDCQQYLMAIEAGEEPTGRIKKIELVLYDESDMVEFDKQEDLQKQIDILTAQLATITDIDISSSDQPLIEDIIIEQDSEENEHLPASQLDLDIYEEDEVIPRSQRL